MTAKISLTDTGTFKKDGWHFQATVGPFDSQQEAIEFVRQVALRFGIGLGPFQEETTPPALGVNVSETIATKDNFG